MARKREAVSGIREMKKRMKVGVRNMSEAILQQMLDNGGDLLVRSMALSPQLTGDHINSGVVTKVSPFVVVISFNEPYSVSLHEDRYNLGPISRRKPPTEDGAIGRQYLRRPFELHKKRYIDEIGRTAFKALRQSLR